MTPKFDSLFSNLFGAEQSAKAKEEYRWALEKAVREGQDSGHDAGGNADGDIELKFVADKEQS